MARRAQAMSASLDFAFFQLPLAVLPVQPWDDPSSTTKN